MIATATRLADVRMLEPRRFADPRGWFCESWNRTTLAGVGIDADFVQDNHSMSFARGTVRGLHFQAPPRAQAKLVRCGQGALLDVAVDIRAGSPGFGTWVAVELSAENGRQLFIPEGFLHGFVTLVPDTEIVYKCTDTYAPEADGAVRFDDPDLAIDWGSAWGIDTRGAVLSDKDAKAPLMRDFTTPFTYSGPA